jgi:putative addiction module killer protein
MGANQRQVLKYSDARGREPLSAWLKTLKDAKGRAAVYVRINRMEHGNFGDYVSVGDGVFEMRIHLGPGYRIYFGVDDDESVLLLCGGPKRSQRRDTARAKRIWKEHKKTG